MGHHTSAKRRLDYSLLPSGAPVRRGYWDADWADAVHSGRGGNHDSTRQNAHGGQIYEQPSFGQANGHVVKCTAMGDMPVIAKTESNEVIRFSFTNVRCVPGFKYTLLSVTQMWEEQRIDARFRDLNHLELPPSAGGITIPYDEKSSFTGKV